LVKSDLGRIDAMREEDIDYSDIPATTDRFWKDAKVVSGSVRDQSIVAGVEPEQARSSHEKSASESTTAAGNVPRSAAESRVWTILEESKVSTMSIVEREREGELVSEDLLNSRIRTCR